MAVALVLAAAGAGGAYRTGAPVAHTGGFGEPDCGACHQAAGAAPPAIELVAPAGFDPGREYPLKLRLARPGMAAAGFQLSVRFASGARAGRQAGELRAASPGTRVIVAEETGIQYAGHDAAGAGGGPTDERVWVIRWVAPDTAAPVLVHAAANAANDDDSEFGDAVVTTSREIAPVAGH